MFLVKFDGASVVICLMIFLPTWKQIMAYILCFISNGEFVRVIKKCGVRCDFCLPQ